LTEQLKTSQIANISQQIEKLREQTFKVNAQIEKFIEKRDQLHEKIRASHQEINQLKTERDSLNEKVKLLKQQRDFTRTKILEIVEKIKVIDEKIKELKKKTPRVNQRELQEELDAIEWKIQTTSLDLQEEKRLIENVKQLEIQLGGFKKIDRQYKKIAELQNERKPLQAQADGFHHELTEIVKKSQDLHQKMIMKFEQVKNDKAEADNQHKAYIESKEKTKDLLVEIAVLTGHINGLQNSIREQNRSFREKESDERAKEREKAEEERKQKMLSEKGLKEKLGSEAKDKLQRGEKLSWNEFQLVMGDDAENDSETQD
jgi:uncharacterized coiled-coil DUF342 family protein